MREIFNIIQKMDFFQGAGEEGIVCSLKYFALMKENLQEEIGEKMYDISSS